jgi:Icc protein
MTTRIVQITDLHLFRDADERLFGIPTRELLQDVLDHVAAHAGRVDHLVITGDHTHDDLPETYEALREMLAPWLDRLWQLPGNHDARPVLRAVFGDRIDGDGGERISFSFAADGWLCLGLDTQVPGAVGGLVDEEHMRWVEEQLRTHDPVGAVLFLHHPPLDTGLEWLDRIGLDGKELLRALLVAEPRLRLVCAGHIHHERAERVGEAEIVTTPATGLEFSPTSPTKLFVRSAPGYRIVELDDEGHATWVVRLTEARYTPDMG